MLRIAVFIDKLEVLDISHDTTLMIIKKGLKRNHDIHIFHEDGILIRDGNVLCNLSKVINENDSIVLNECLYQKIDSFDVLFLRKDPPIDLNYYTALSILSLVESKILTVNSPKGILSFSEKLWPIALEMDQPPTLVSCNKDIIFTFKYDYNDIVIKPLYDFCGNGIYLSLGKDKNFGSVINTLLKSSLGMPVVVQKFLPNVELGDRRVIMLGGIPICAINRIASENDYRCNMKTGGTPILHELSDSEKKICEKLSPLLIENGLHFVGIDIIDGFVTEINTTSPTGVPQILELGGPDISDYFWDFIERKTK